MVIGSTLVSLAAPLPGSHSVIFSGLSCWVGPLLYHFADMSDERSVELSYEAIRRLMLRDCGFELVVSVVPLVM